MATKTISQTELRNNIKENFDDLIQNNEVLIVHRGKSKDVVVLPLDEYNSIMETFHLIRNGNNMKKLFESLEQAEAGKTKKINLDEI